MKFPEPDAARYKCHQVMQKPETAITGLVLQVKAAKFWSSLPIFITIEEPKFPEAWLLCTKRAYYIRKFTLYSEPAFRDKRNKMDFRML